MFGGVVVLCALLTALSGVFDFSVTFTRTLVSAVHKTSLLVGFDGNCRAGLLLSVSEPTSCLLGKGEQFVYMSRLAAVAHLD